MLFLCAVALNGACSGSSQPRSRQASGRCSPQPWEQWHGGFEVVSSCWGGVTARLGAQWVSLWVGEVMGGKGWMGTQ